MATLTAPDTLRLWRQRPDAMVGSLWPVMGPLLDDWQIDGLRYAGAPIRNKRLVFTAAAGVGKTAELAWLGWHRLLCYGRIGEHPKGAAISMDGPNLHANLVPEMARWRQSSKLLTDQFEMNSERIYSRQFPDTWFLDFRSWPKKANREEQGRTLSGLHSAFPFVLMDESATIPVSVGQTAMQIESVCEDSLIAQGGNPATREGTLYWAAVQNASEWHHIEITADPDDPRRCKRVPIEWARARIAEAQKTGLGRDDPWIQIFILGRFPDAAINQLLTVEDVLAAMERSPKQDEYNWAPVILSVDVARQGLDWSVIYRRQHTMVWQPIRRRSLTGPQGAALVATEWNAHRAAACFIDNTGGFGGSWIDHLRPLGFAPVGVQYSGKDQDPTMFNKRAGMWWRMAEAIKTGCALPKGAEQLIGDLSTPTYTFVKDKLLLEDKASIAARLKRSPDDGDALAENWAFPVATPRSGLDLSMANQRAEMATFDDGDPRKPYKR